MDGQEVYKFAVTAVPHSLQKTIQAAGLTVEDIDYFALHQANIRILQSVAKRLKYPRISSRSVWITVEIFPRPVFRFSWMR